MVEKEHVLTPEDYAIANENGISYSTVHSRFYKLHWDKQDCITVKPNPTGKRFMISKIKEYSLVAEKNGIPYATYYKRYTDYGWSLEKSATTPVTKGAGRKRIYSLKDIERAASYGVSKQTLARRLRDSWELEDAITTPQKKRTVSKPYKCVE